MTKGLIKFQTKEEAEVIAAYLKGKIPDCEPQQPYFQIEYPEDRRLDFESHNQVVYLEVDFPSQQLFETAREEIHVVSNPPGKLQLTLY